MTRNFARQRTEAVKAITSRFSLDISPKIWYNLTERNGTERNGNDSYTFLLTFLFVFLFIALPACSAGNPDTNNSSQSSFTFTNSNQLAGLTHLISNGGLSSKIIILVNDINPYGFGWMLIGSREEHDVFLHRHDLMD